MRPPAPNAFVEIDMTANDGGKGSGRRPGDGYGAGWERVFGKKPQQPVPAPKEPK